MRYSLSKLTAYTYLIVAAGVTFSDSDSATVPKFLNPDSGPEYFQI